MSKVKVFNIVFLQYGGSLDAIAEHFNVDDWSDLNDEQLIEYLKQWDCGDDELAYTLYDAELINTEFLGYDIGDNYLFSRNDALNYIGLSRYETI